ncbi:MAG: endonuclease/exonuclease/phosphatase family protein [Bacillota bacterium]|nr:endonuclease/exonuclease/phosphatase family protein [Bacillota bacterium]
MRRNFVGVLIVVLLFSMIAVIPRGYSQLNLRFDYLFDSNSGTIEVNLTTPVYITSIPIEIYDSEGKLIVKRDLEQYFTKRIENTRFNRYILNMDIPEKLPIRAVLFPGSSIERTYMLNVPQVDIDIKNREVKVYLEKNSAYNLTFVNGSMTSKHSVLAEKDGWHRVDVSEVPNELMLPGTALYSTITFPGGLSTSVTRYIPRIVVEAGKEYLKVKGWGLSGETPEIKVYDRNSNIKSKVGGTLYQKNGEFVFQNSFEETIREVRDGDRIAYKEKGYSFQFDIPYFYATYRKSENAITGTVNREGRVVFQYGSKLLEAVPDNRGRFRIDIGEDPEVQKLVTIKGGYISPSGNEYWKRFNWRNVFMVSPLDSSPVIDLRVMTYNIHHAISPDGRIDIDGIARVIEESGAQVVGLQEVDKRFIRTLFMDQTRRLAEKLDMYYYFGDALNILGAEYGNAILSKFPIISVSNLQLDSKEESRGVLSARIDVNGKEINFLVTHLSLNRSTRNRQLQQIKSYLEILEGEVILVGDFNSAPDSGEIMYISRELKEVVGDLEKNELHTFQRRDGTRVQIDYIFVSPEIASREAFTIDSDASDHLPLVADIRIKDI